MKVDKFDEFLNSLFESYDSHVDIKWIDKDNKLIGLFSVEGRVYQITCINKGGNVWTYKFHIYDTIKNGFSPELTNFNTGKMSVLSTIRRGMDYLINTKSPNAIIFGALDESESRKKLYWIYSSEIVREYEYERITQNQNNKQIFILYKKIDKNYLLTIVKNIIEETINEI